MNLWSIKFGHFNVQSGLKINRHSCFILDFYARVYGKIVTSLDEEHNLILKISSINLELSFDRKILRNSLRVG